MGQADGTSRPLVAIAPMLAVTNTHFRNFMRLLTRYSTLYTEMVVDNTIKHNTHQIEDFLGFDDCEHPIVCQLGGSSPQDVAEAAAWVEKAGYDEVNLNVGCPSCRVVSKGCFGAALMKTPEKVREIVHAMKRQVQIPVTVKCRLGVDDLDSPEFTHNFVKTVAEGGCEHIVVHARKAWLQGVDPKKNRSVPPLMYDRVYTLCQSFPNLHFSINGGVNSLNMAKQLLLGEYNTDGISGSSPRATSLKDEDGYVLNGVMIGRAAANNPCCLAEADTLIYGARDVPESARSRRNLLLAYVDYLEKYEGTARKLRSPFVLLKPVLGVLSGVPGQRHFRQIMDQKIRCAPAKETAVDALLQAIDAVDDAFPGVLDIPLTSEESPVVREHLFS